MPTVEVNSALATPTGLIGHDGSGPGTVTPAKARTLINVENGAEVTSTAKVDAAGAVMNTDTSTAAMQFVVDEDDMVSDLATKVPTQQSTKAYVDAAIAALGTMSAQDADSVNITGGSIAGITDLAVADGGTGASTAANARTNLGLGTIATQAASAVAITGGSIAGITDLAVADGGTGASSAGDARTNLGLGTIATQAANAVAITGGTATGLTRLRLAVLSSEPSTPINGELAYADGDGAEGWDPGDGEGFYGYENGAWRKISWSPGPP